VGVPELGVVPHGGARRRRRREGALPARDVVGRPVRGAWARRRRHRRLDDARGRAAAAAPLAPPQLVEPRAHRPLLWVAASRGECGLWRELVRAADRGAHSQHFLWRKRVLFCRGCVGARKWRWQLSLPECFCRGVWPVSVCFGWYAKGFVLNFYCSGELKRVLVNDLPDRHETNVQAGNNEVNKLFEN
jgi:hypothetical protein